MPLQSRPACFKQETSLSRSRDRRCPPETRHVPFRSNRRHIRTDGGLNKKHEEHSMLETVGVVKSLDTMRCAWWSRGMNRSSSTGTRKAREPQRSRVCIDPVHRSDQVLCGGKTWEQWQSMYNKLMYSQPYSPWLDVRTHHGTVRYFDLNN